MKRHLILSSMAALALAPLVALGAESKDNAETPPVAFTMDNAEIDRSNREKMASYADMLEKVTPAVVSVRTAQVVRMMPRNQIGLEDFLRRFHGLPPLNRDATAAQPQERKEQVGLGSGTIIHADGYILTNKHVISVEDRYGRSQVADEITVELADKREFQARVIGTDPRTDVAVLKIEGKDLPVAKVANSAGLRVGDVVFAIGNPLGIGMTVTSGIVSAMGREVGILGQAGLESFIQTDAAINRGNSGGPLIDTNGRVVGMNTAILSQTGGSIGIGFAVPSNLALDIVGSLVNSGEVSRGFLGIEGQNLTPQLAEALKLEKPQGVLVSRVAEDSPAEKGGVQVEDVILSLNGEPVETWSALRYQASRLKPGDAAKVEISRNGKKRTLQVTVGAVEVPMFQDTELKTLDDDLRKRFDIPAAVQGVVIARVGGKSIFVEHVPAGTVVLAVNSRLVTTPADMAREMRKEGPNLLRLYRDGRTYFLTIKP